MRTKYKQIVTSISLVVMASSSIILATNCAHPTSYFPLPTNRQLAWHSLEQYAFVHFSMTTFDTRTEDPNLPSGSGLQPPGPDGGEWGYGDCPVSYFDPTNYDADQWVKSFKDAGLTQVVLTAKHHDGFCLWPSKYTDYSIARTPFNEKTGGHADIVRDVSNACHKYGLKFGVYLSPWDRHRIDYGLPPPSGGIPTYVEYYRNQLTELLTNYGEISEVWFDGAQGGWGYYGGANEKRDVDNKTYYDWDNTYKLVRKLAPNAVMCQGADLRWCGNEHGQGGDPNWNTLNVSYPDAHTLPVDELNHGDEDGQYWIPSEVDVSDRPGWFYHPSQDTQVKTSEELFQIYLQSVGRGAGLILNVPPDRTGRVNASDVSALTAWKQLRDNTFQQDLVKNVKYVGNNCYEIVLGSLKTINYLLLQEDLRIGQHVKTFDVQAQKNNNWESVALCSTIGNKRIVKFAEPITTQKLRVNITEFIHGYPRISNIQVF